jgi:alpha-acetolactate decarboxylase
MDTSDKFEFSMVEGTCVGSFAPDFCGGIKNPGFHLHFIDDSLFHGGHVLDFKCQQGNLSRFEPKSFTVEFFNLNHTLKAKQIA